MKKTAKQKLIIIRNAMSLEMVARIRTKARQRPKLQQPKFSKAEVEQILALASFED